MNLNQLDDLFTKIKVHRAKFGKLLEAKSTYYQYRNEWYRILKDYDFEDVNKKLDEWFSDSENQFYLPDVYVLVSDLQTIKEKNKPYDFKLTCKYCKKWFDYKKLNQHEFKCRSVEYIIENYKRFFNKELSRENLWNLNEEEFKSKYYSSLESFLNKLDPNTLDYKNIKNILATRNGGEAIYSITGEEIKHE